jgi:hypothetical protein
MSIKSPGAGYLVGAGLLLGVVGVFLLSITAEEGGFRVYHPYDFLGLAIAALGAVLLVAGLWRFTHQ